MMRASCLAYIRVVYFTLYTPTYMSEKYYTYTKRAEISRALAFVFTRARLYPSLVTRSVFISLSDSRGVGGGGGPRAHENKTWGKKKNAALLHLVLCVCVHIHISEGAIKSLGNFSSIYLARAPRRRRCAGDNLLLTQPIRSLNHFKSDFLLFCCCKKINKKYNNNNILAWQFIWCNWGHHQAFFGIQLTPSRTCCCWRLRVMMNWHRAVYFNVTMRILIIYFAIQHVICVSQKTYII